MLHTKPIETISYQDIIDFCSQLNRENIYLDYKQDIDTGLVKTISAMANTLGGIIVIGVEDQDSKPKLPITGIPYREHIREQINNMILGNITPPVFPEIQVCKSDDGNNALVLLRIPPSHMTPHAIRNNSKVYIRTDTSNEPEELASVDRVLWLVDKRRKSTELKEGFYKSASERFNTCCGKIIVEHCDTILAASPLYPFNVLIDYKKLRESIANDITVRGWNGSQFPRNLHNGEYKAMQNGAYSFIAQENTGYVSYEEFNHFGFFYHRRDFCHSDKSNDGVLKHYMILWEILYSLDLFLESMGNLYKILGYWGLIEIKFVLDKLSNVIVRDLPLPRNMRRWEDITHIPINDRLEFSRTLSVAELKEKRVDILLDLFKDIAWSLGFSHLQEEHIRKLMEEYNRLN